MYFWRTLKSIGSGYIGITNNEKRIPDGKDIGSSDPYYSLGSFFSGYIPVPVLLGISGGRLQTLAINIARILWPKTMCAVTAACVRRERSQAYSDGTLSSKGRERVLSSTLVELHMPLLEIAAKDNYELRYQLYGYKVEGRRCYNDDLLSAIL